MSTPDCDPSKIPLLFPDPVIDFYLKKSTAPPFAKG